MKAENSESVPFARTLTGASRLRSNYKPLCAVAFPAYQGRQKYMHTFDLAVPVMAEGFEDYAEAVKALCAAAGATRGIAHMTVDEKDVDAGMSQRRPRPHVDGCFYPALESWGGGGGGWNHYCNNVNGPNPLRRMPVIVASDVPGCRAWRGEFDGMPSHDGDLSHLDLPEGEVLPANLGYLLSADCVHESMIMPSKTRRMFLRIALPVDFVPDFSGTPAGLPAPEPASGGGNPPSNMEVTP